MKIFNILVMVLLFSGCGVNVDTPSLSSVPLNVEKELSNRQKIAEELEKDKAKATIQKRDLLQQQSESKTYFEEEFKAVEPNKETIGQKSED